MTISHPNTLPLGFGRETQPISAFTFNIAIDIKCTAPTLLFSGFC